MDDPGSPEWQSIREAQRDLRARMEALDRRIDLIGKSRARADAPPPLPQVSPLPPAASPLPPPVAPPPEKSRLFTEMEAMPSIFTNPAPPPIPPKPASAEQSEKGGFEMQVGRVWLVRIGILILLTGLVFLGNFAWTEFITKLGALGKLALIYLAGAGLGATGWWVKRKREELSTYGKVLVGGGIATIYYATYAAHFVDPLRVIGSPLLGGFLLMALAVGIIWLANRMRSQAVAAVTVLLGFYTAAINPIAGFSLFSNLVLSVIAIVLLVQRRWLSISFLSLVGCYLSFAFWRFHNGTLFTIPVEGPSVFWTALLFPACYWITFTVATFLGRAETFPAGTRPAFLTINNGAFFGLTAPLVVSAYPDQFWLFTLAYGALLLGLAAFAGRRDQPDGSFDGTYLTQGLVLISLGFLFKFSGYQLAIVLALQSATLMKLSQLRHGKILQIFSGLSAIGATSGALYALVVGSPHAMLTGGAVSVVLVAVAWLFKAQRGFLQPPSFQYRAAGYVALATGLGPATVLLGEEGSTALYLLIGLALAATASVYVLRMPEVVLGAQAFAVAVVGYWLVGMFSNEPSLAESAILALALLALMHWWQRQAILQFEKSWLFFWQSVHALAVVLVTLVWILDSYHSGPDRLMALAVGAFAILLYAFLTRAWPLVLGSQIISVATGAGLVMAIDEKMPWPVVTGALALFAAQSAIIQILSSRAPAKWGQGALSYAVIIRAVSVFLALAIMQTYLPKDWLYLAFSGLAFGLFLIAMWRNRAEALFYASLAFLLALWAFAGRLFGGYPAIPSDLIGFGLVLLAQQIGRRSTRSVAIFGSRTQAALMIIGIAGLWLVMGRMVSGGQGGFLLTVSWSIFALAVFGVGLLVRERVYRLLALAILSISIGRLFLIDVWQFDTLSRILSFLVLGAVLLALGFLYNRFADFFRKWM